MPFLRASSRVAEARYPPMRLALSASLQTSNVHVTPLSSGKSQSRLDGSALSCGAARLAALLLVSRPECTHMHWTQAPKCYSYHCKPVRIQLYCRLLPDKPYPNCLRGLRFGYAHAFVLNASVLPYACVSDIPNIVLGSLVHLSAGSCVGIVPKAHLTSHVLTTRTHPRGCTHVPPVCWPPCHVVYIDMDSVKHILHS